MGAPLGRVLEIDLDQRICRQYPYAEDTALRFLSGRGFNALRLHQEVPPGTDPLGPGNQLFFSCGLLVGSGAPAATRLHVSALSPLTGLLGSSSVGSDLGLALRACGIQAVAIRGRADAPVFIRIDAQGASIRDAGDLWGLDTWQSQTRLAQIQAGAKVLAIGPAGENLVRFACIMAGRDHAAGRTGMGAVMGAKRLKALVVLPPAGKPDDRPGIPPELVKRYRREITRSAEFAFWSRFGGAGYLKWADQMGILGVRNYRACRSETIDRIDGRKLGPHVVKRCGCPGCPVRCKAELRLDNDAADAGTWRRPEFEPLIALGPKCGLDDLPAVVHLDNLCSRLGLDNISAGSAIAFAMDLFERGILDNRDTGGLELTWGNRAAMEVLIRQMAKVVGLGGLLAQGVRRAAATIGKGAEGFAAHVKGLELTGYHPLRLPGTALGYTVASRGGDFTDVYAALEYRGERAGKGDTAESEHAARARLVRQARIAGTVLDCLGLCKVPALSLRGAYDLDLEAAMTAAYTGWEIDPAALFTIGERIVTLERLFNLAHGATCQDDRLPSMFLRSEYVPPGGLTAEDVPAMTRAYYQAMGWDSRGIPEPLSLKALGLDSSSRLIAQRLRARQAPFARGFPAECGT